jgi:LuxR family transcriptional regulator, maltose regulon positive regulatory protein
MTFARTKIQPPRPRSTFVARAGVQDRLAEALLGRRLVLLCAPAGYGKTTLLAQEIAHLPEGSAVAWISADTGDDLQRLVECMLTALEPFDPPWRTAPESLVTRVGTPDEQRAVAAEIINTLAASEVSHGVIVFDDAHRIDDSQFFRFLDGLVERLPARWCVAITTRTEPPLSLARLRAADELLEIRQLHLQFAREEARRLADGSGVDRAIADRLFDRTQGWPAGMRIAVGALQGEAAVGASVERALRASERPLFEFLFTEVLAQLPEGLREFLLAVSVLPELDAERCAQVSGRSDAAALLDAIERLGLFVDALDAPVHTLRLHDLFRDALRQQLRRHDPVRLVEVRRRAAATEGDPIRRIGWLLEASEVQPAASLAFDHLPQLIVTAGAGSALHMVSRFPAAVRERAPELSFVRGLASWAHRWDFATMLESMERAAGEFDARGDRRRERLASAYVATALLGLGRFAEADERLARLRQLDLEPEAQAILLNAEAWSAIEACRFPDVAPLMDQLLDLLQKTDRIDLWYQTTPALRMPGLRGITPVLERHARLMLQVAGDVPTPLRTIAVQTQAWCALWRGQIGTARRLMDSARDDAHWSGQTGAVRAHQLTFDAAFGLVAGDVPGAIAAAEARIQSFSATGNRWHRYILAVFGARIAASGGDLEALRAGLKRVEAARPREGALPRPRELPVLAQLAWLEGRADDAIAAWQQALAIEDQVDVLGLAAEVRLRLALALVRRGEHAAAGRCLAPLFERARIDGPGGALFAVDALREIGSVHWKGSLRASHAGQLRAWLGCVEPERSSRSNQPPLAASTGMEGASAAAFGAASPHSLSVATSLTARELEVLDRIAAGDSNKLIARALDVSLHTVKRHVANILGKLAVETRGQAAAWYRSHRGPLS